jgi:hypothetical protein
VVGGLDPKDGLPDLDRIGGALGLLRLGRPEDALRALETVEGGGPMLALLRAEVAGEAGDPIVAERYARASVEASPDLAWAWVLLGEALEAGGKQDAAAAWDVLPRSVASASVPGTSTPAPRQSAGAAPKHFGAARPCFSKTESVWLPKRSSLRSRGTRCIGLTRRCGSREPKQPQAGPRLACSAWHAPCGRPGILASAPSSGFCCVRCGRNRTYPING